MTDIIPEIKLRSPFGFESVFNEYELFNMAMRVPSRWIAVHTDSRWGGSMSNVALAAEQSDRFVLAKGIHAMDPDIKQAFEKGADAVTVVGRVPDQVSTSHWLEPLSPEQFETWANTELFLPDNVVIIVNARDLATGKVRRGDDYLALWERYHQIAADANLGRVRWVQASGIRDEGDAYEDATFALVGTNMPHFVKH